MNRTFTWDGRTHNLLSHTTAMGCYSWSLPAVITCPGRSANMGRQDSICDACYACQGLYMMPNVSDCLAARLAWTRWSLQDQTRRLVWIDTMVAAILHTTKPGGYFRWHDSGDVFSPEYCSMIQSVCARTPDVHHWVPTRSWGLPWADALVRLNRLPNVVVRPSSHYFDAPAPIVQGLADGLVSHTDASHVPAEWSCPKADPANPATNCDTAGCRVCWGNDCTVSYHAHGRAGEHHPTSVSKRSIGRIRDACERKLAFVPVDDVR